MNAFGELGDNGEVTADGEVNICRSELDNLGDSLVADVDDDAEGI